jgi:hypothetical protein
MLDCPAGYLEGEIAGSAEAADFLDNTLASGTVPSPPRPSETDEIDE